jgi:OmpA-OmpF porin, OOP family
MTKRIKQLTKSWMKQRGSASSQTPGDGEVAPVKKDEDIKYFYKYDFIPGEKILYTEDFEQEALAELPTSWNTNGSGEVVTLEKYSGKWLRLHNPFIYLTGNTKELTENYTAEFDVILQLKNNGWMYPTFSTGFFATNGEPGANNAFLKEYDKYAAVMGTIYPEERNNSRVLVESFKDNAGYFKSEPKNYGELEKYYGKPVHIAIQVQQQRLRMWINETKVFDVPRGIDTTYKMNQLFFKVGQTNYKEEQYGIYISNIKTAAGLPDTRHKLIEEGKFSTTGILFDVNSATIKAESNGVLKEIAEVLKQFPETKIKITGHTDSDGSDAANLELSKKRAAAVRQALANNFSIEITRLESDGKGESTPVSDSKTKEGKAQNRRVEFIKL